ncbi:hypothetical protein BT93_L2600 [Corymbia citriodora subsp. variegata]|uniref:Zinc finger PHD-type domain-containing protein n=1 Tax=Corymbia citriodora subsp. variegata TaxID=360336 RepID=A0A8T0CZP3_CORYI|nr:hypothetical protein BT93_L2600 [Corymbia citriodora subsp. variegata]
MGYNHPSHLQHALVICAKGDYEHAQCTACGESCTGMIYGCKECNFFIHYACLDLPEKVSHPSHPPHPLDLIPEAAPFTCTACLTQRGGFHFRCPDPACCFTIDVCCAFPSPPIVLQGHRHLLCFFDQVGAEKVEPRLCKACRQPCQSSVMCCLKVDCHFALHLLCGCSSCLFQHLPCHRDRLKLRASMKCEEEEDDNDDNLVENCKVCGEEIEDTIPVFHCNDCKYVVHVKCLFSQAKRGGMKLKIIPNEAQDGEKEINLDTEEEKEHVQTFGDFIKSFNDREKSELEDVCKKRVAEIIKVLAWRKNVEGSFSNSNSPFLDEAFLEFRNKLQLGIEHSASLAVASENDRIVKMVEYKVTQKLAPVLKEVFANYGDVSAEATINSKAKNMVFIMLCGTIYNMTTTKIADVSESLLYNWWKYIIFIHLSKFKIQFAIDRLKVVMRAHYNLQDRNNSVAKTEKKIMDISEEIKENKKKLKEMGMKLDKKKLKVKQERGELPMDENLMEAYLNNASAWKWELSAKLQTSPQ